MASEPPPILNIYMITLPPSPLPPSPCHLISPLTCLETIKIDVTYNFKMINLHNTHLGQWTNFKMYLKLPTPKLLYKKSCLPIADLK